MSFFRGLWNLSLVLLLIPFFTNKLQAQTLIINEVSNGPSGNMEYVEFVVVSDTVTYNCDSLTLPTIDIRGWIFDDNSGYHGTSGIAAGAVRFSQNALWSNIPIGTIIVIYNNGDINTAMPANDLSTTDGNCRLIVPVNSTLFESNTTTPGAVACSYPATGWTSGGNWNYTVLANSGDCARIVNLAGCEVFSLCYGTDNLNNQIYFSGSGGQTVYYFNGGDPTVQANWSSGSASPSPGMQTPGDANNAANAAYIGQFNNNCLPLTPLVVTASSTNAGCTCTGSATASASGSIGGYTYKWLDATYAQIGQNTATASNLCPGTYYVVATSHIGCTDTATVVISSTSSTSVTVNSSTICQGSAATLTATPSVSGGTYSWSPGGQTTSSITVSPASTTTYTVTYTASGCSATGNGTITVLNLPTVNAGTDQTVCSGTSVTLSGSGSASTYSWNNSVTNGTAFTPSSTATYTLTGTATNGCTATDQVVVTVNPLPTVVVNDASVCSGGSVTLTASGASTYSWSPSTGLSATTGASVTANPAATTTYTITGTSTAGCTATDAATVTVLSNAPINAGTNVSVCTGSSTVLTASGGTSYSWNNGLGSGNNFSVSPASTTTYTVIGTDANGCTGTDAVTITVNSLPTVNAGADQTICQGTSSTLTATGATSYSWNNGVTNGIAFTAVSTQTYTVTGTDANSCINTDQVVITVNPLPTVNAGADQTICAGSSVILSATGAAAYSWNNGVSNGISFTPTSTQTYTVSGTDANGCTNSDQVVVAVNSLPPVNAGTDQTICEGNTVTLTASGASTYTWNNGVSNGTAFSPSVGTTTYTVTGTSSAGCNNTDQVVVIVNANPTPVINGTTTYCIGSQATLTTDQVYASYNWSTGATTQSIQVTTANNPVTVNVTNAAGCSATSAAVNVTQTSTITTNYTYSICQGDSLLIHGIYQSTAGTYTQTFSSVSGCDSTDNVTLQINSLPAVNAGTDQTVCTGSTITLTATGATSYSWNNGITNGVAFTPASGTTTYTVTGTSAAGCVNTDQVNVTVNSLPIVNAGTDQTVCNGSSVTLNGSGASTYNWNNGVTNGTAFTPAATQTYTVTGTDANGCTNTDQVVVTVNSLPTVNAGADQNICGGTSVTLTGSGAQSYSWNNGISNGTVFTPTTTQTYTVTGTASTGCTNTDQVVVTVNALPTINAGTDVSICMGNSTTLTASGTATTFSWTPATALNNTTLQSVIANPTVITTYTVNGTDANGCTASDQVMVTVNSLPTVNAGADQTICAGNSVTLTASGTATVYNWNNNITNGVSFSPSSTNTYIVNGTDVNGCSASDQVVVTVNTLPVVFAGNDLVICEGSSVVLTATGATTYNWDNGISNGQLFYPYTTTTYSVTGTTTDCISTDQVTVTVVPVTPVNIFTDLSSGCAPLTVSLSTDNPNTSYYWSFSDGTSQSGTSAFHTFFNTGCYDVTITGTNEFGCNSQATLTDFVCVDELPVADFTSSAYEISEITHEVTFTNESENAVSYWWNFGDSYTSFQTNPIHDYSMTSMEDYTVTLVAYSENGCSDTAQLTLHGVEDVIFYVPNAFTPDGDSYNQQFKPVFTSGYDPQQYTLLIFDRWGEIIFESHNTEIGWDGSYGSKNEIEMVQDGVYTWKITFKTKENDEHRMVVGHVNLLR